jgi:hypothetical protein
MRWPLLAIAIIAVALVACSNINNKRPRPTATITPSASETPTPIVSAFDLAPTPEADDDPDLPGEYVDLPEIYNGYYGNDAGINTAAHVEVFVDYSPQGLPPAGGPHWGSARCGETPATSPAFCGPAPWGIYREPWPAETLVHNMEHAGAVIWYNTADQSVIDDLESFADAHLADGMLLVLAPYPDMDAETIAITVWSRRDKFSAGDYDADRLQDFLDVLYCRFDPEQFCPDVPTPSPGDTVSR